MIRANLLPRSRESLALFGLTVDLDYLRTSALGCCLIVAAVAAAAGVETARLSLVRGDAVAAETTLAQEAGSRANAQRVAFDVARLEATARRATELHRSGNDVARAIARLGNAIPSSVFLDTVTSDRETVRLSGKSSSLDRIGETVTALVRSLPAMRVTLGDIDDRSAQDDGLIAFTAVIEPAPPRAASAHHPVPPDDTR